VLPTDWPAPPVEPNGQQVRERGIAPDQKRHRARDDAERGNHGNPGEKRRTNHSHARVVRGHGVLIGTAVDRIGSRSKTRPKLTAIRSSTSRLSPARRNTLRSELTP